MTLLTKNKLGFVDGSIKRENYIVDSEKKQWDRCNAMVLSWLMNNVSKNLLSGIVFRSNAALVWSDLKKRFDKVNMSRIFICTNQLSYILKVLPLYQFIIQS